MTTVTQEGSTCVVTSCSFRHITVMLSSAAFVDIWQECKEITRNCMKIDPQTERKSIKDSTFLASVTTDSSWTNTKVLVACLIVTTVSCVAWSCSPSTSGWHSCETNKNKTALMIKPHISSLPSGITVLPERQSREDHHSSCYVFGQNLHSSKKTRRSLFL